MKTNRLEQLLNGSEATKFYTKTQTAKFDKETSILRIYTFEMFNESNSKLFFEKKIPATQVDVLRNKFPNIFK